MCIPILGSVLQCLLAPGQGGSGICKLVAGATGAQLVQLVLHHQISLGRGYCHHPLTNASGLWAPLQTAP